MTGHKFLVKNTKSTINEEEYLTPLLVLDELLATMIFFYEHTDSSGIILNSKNGLCGR